MSQSREWIYSIDEINDVVKEFLEVFYNYKTICLKGELGAGKTTLIKSFCSLLGCNDDVTSPSFSLINQYKTDKSEIFHLDLYRLKNLEEAMDLGIEELIYSGSYCFIEWYEKIKNVLPTQNVVYCEINILNNKKRRLIAKTIQ